MNPELNPFTPGPGMRPIELFGRESIIKSVQVDLAKIQNQKAVVPLFLYGLRGVGKTVILVEAANIAIQKGIITHRLEIEDTQLFNFQRVIFNLLKNILFELDRTEKIKAGINKIWSIFKSFSLKYEGAEFAIDVAPMLGKADSLDFNTDLLDLILSIGELAKDKNQSVCICIDEIQNLKKAEMAALLGAMHRIVQDTLPLYFLCAGLPSLLNDVTDAKSYAERFRFKSIGPLSIENVHNFFNGTLSKLKCTITDDAIEAIFDKTKGYPYFVQQFGSSIWDDASKPEIDFTIVKKAIPIAIAVLDESFFKTRFEKSTDEEKRFMLCMAQDKSGPPYSTISIAECLKKPSNHIGLYRSRLIKKGFIFTVAHGKVDFTIPLFQDYLIRQEQASEKYLGL